MEAGQILHNNPVGHAADAFVAALVSAIREEISRVYWNVNQRPFYGNVRDREYVLSWALQDASAPPLGIPGIEWWPYYNWGGAPGDTDWDQAAADRANFSFEGVEFRWYKNFGRSLNVNVVWPAEKWQRWFMRCIQTLDAWEYERCPALRVGRSGQPPAYPDPAGAVPLEGA